MDDKNTSDPYLAIVLGVLLLMIGLMAHRILYLYF